MNKKLISVLSIICMLSICLLSLHRETFANNVHQNKCRVTESIKNSTSYEYSKYQYDNYGNKIALTTPYKNIMDETTTKTLEFVFKPILDSKYSRSLTYYDYNGKRIWGGNCNDKNYSDCLSKKPVFKSYYDSKGNKKDIYAAPDGKQIHYWYIYNNKGQKIEEIDICSKYPELTCYTRYQYTYNTQGKLATTYCKRQWQKDKFSEYYDKYLYDTKGNLSEYKNECNKDYTKCSHTTKYEYDNSGKKIKETWTWTLTKPEITLYKYDAKGRLIIKNKCNQSATNYCMEKYEYNTYGNKIKEYHSCDIHGNNCTWLNKYEYDSYNNLITKYSCNSDGTLCKQEEKNKYECK